MSAFTLTILNAGTEMDLHWEIVQVDVYHALNRIPIAEIVLADGSLASQEFTISNDDFFKPGEEIEIKIRWEEEDDATLFKGLVTKQKVEARQGGFYLTIELADAAIKMTRQRAHIIHLEKTDSDVFSELISKHGLTDNSGDATTPTYPELVQYYTSDWDFMLTRAEANAMLIKVKEGGISWFPVSQSGSPEETLELGISEINSLEIEADGLSQLAEVTASSWDPVNQALFEAASAEDPGINPGNLDAADLATKLGGDLCELRSAVLQDADELQAWANGKLSRSRLAKLVGRITVEGKATYEAGSFIEVAGVSDRFNDTVLLTGVRHRVSQEGWDTDLQIGLRNQPYTHIHPESTEYPAAALLPGVRGLQIGVISDFEEDPNGELRVRVSMPGLGEDEGIVWARLLSPDAGVGRGFFFRPEVGDEVILGFLNDDPRQAIIIGSLYGSVNTPPVETVDEDNFLKGIYSREGISIQMDDEKKILTLLTSEGRKIVLDEDAGILSLGDDHGNEIIMDSNGIQIKSGADINLEASGNIVIKGSEVDVQ